MFVFICLYYSINRTFDKARFGKFICRNDYVKRLIQSLRVSRKASRGRTL